MVQTRKGAGENPWLSYMRACAANYQAGVPQPKGDCDCHAKPRRITGKTPDPKAKAKPAKDTQTIDKAVKATWKAKAKAKPAKPDREGRANSPQGR